MKSIKKSIKAMSSGVKSSVVYTLSSLFSKGLAFITMPVFTRLMQPDDIGVVNLYNSWHAIIAVVASLALTSGGFSLAMKEFKDERDQYLSSSLALTSGIALLLGAVYCVAPNMWNRLLGMPSELMILLIVHLLLSPAYDFWLMRQRYEYKYKAAGAVSFLSAFAAAAVSIAAVVTAAENGMAQLGTVRLYANYAVLLSVALFFWVRTFLKGKTFFSTRFWKFSLILSVPLIGNSFASQVLSVSDRVMIDRMVGTGAVGIYSTLYTVSSISLLIWNAINASFVPYLFDNLDKPEKKNSINSIASKLLAAYSVLAFLMTAAAPEIVRILATEEYYEAIYIMPPIAAGVFLTSVTNLYSNILIYHKKTKYIMVSTMTAACVNVVLNYWGIRWFGYTAAAYTTLIAYVVHALIQGMMAIRIHKQITGGVIYDTTVIFGLGVVTILLCLLCLPLYRYSLLRYCTIAFAVAVCVVRRRAIIYALQFRNKG